MQNLKLSEIAKMLEELKDVSWNTILKYFILQAVSYGVPILIYHFAVHY